MKPEKLQKTQTLDELLRGNAVENEQSEEETVGESEQEPLLIDDGEFGPHVPTLEALLDWNDKEIQELSFDLQLLIDRGRDYLNAVESQDLFVKLRIIIVTFAMLLLLRSYSPDFFSFTEEHWFIWFIAQLILFVTGVCYGLICELSSGHNLLLFLVSRAPENKVNSRKEYFLEIIEYLGLNKSSDYSIHNVIEKIKPKIDYPVLKRNKKKKKIKQS